MLTVNGKMNISFNIEDLVEPFMAHTLSSERSPPMRQQQQQQQQLENRSQRYWSSLDGDEDEPFFASNLLYYPELPQPQHVGPYQTYRNWRVFGKHEHQHHQAKSQHLAKHAAKEQDIPSLSGIIEKQIAPVSRLQWHQVMEQWNLRSLNRIPHQDAPLARELPLPPPAWLKELKPPLDWQRILQPTLPKTLPKPKQSIKWKTSTRASKKRQHYLQSNLPIIGDYPNLKLNSNLNLNLNLNPAKTYLSKCQSQR